MKKRIFLILTIPFVAYTLTLPKEPEVKSPELKEEITGTSRYVTIEVHGTEFKIKGIITIKDFKLKLKTEREGFTFYKDISSSSIKEIVILSWKGILYDKEKSTYLFYPIHYKIIDNDNITFEYKQNIKELNKLIVNTTYGKTTLFSIFFDYFNGKKWESGIEGLKLIRETPIPRVFTKITFEEKQKT